MKGGGADWLIYNGIQKVNATFPIFDIFGIIQLFLKTKSDLLLEKAFLDIKGYS